MKSITFLVLSVALSVTTFAMENAWGDSSLVRKTEQGMARGIPWDESTLAWLGLPYATPPVEELRWKAPRSPKPFTEVYDGSGFSSECTQVGGLLLDLKEDTFGEPMGSEDCLYLNIWRPNHDEKDLPVFFWIHGGMNSVGEGATSLYHGANLARETNAVVVTINYRLGLLGWFAHEALQSGNAIDDSGNYGLLDIIAALQWVKKNIASFGGNPENVTIAGESGGAYNVISLLGSPLAANLFHRAFAASPAASLDALSMQKAREKADDFFKRILLEKGLAKNRSGAEDLIRKQGSTWVKKTLLSLSNEEIMGYSAKLSDIGLNEIGLVSDVLGAARFEDGIVISSGYKSALISGDVNRVPLILGSNAEEFKIFEIAFGIITKLDEVDVLNLILEFDPSSAQFKVTDFMPWVKLPQYQFWGKALGDALFQKTGVDPVAKHYSRYADVFVFKFSWNDQPEPFNFLVGASHMMELPFVFGNFQMDKQSMFRFAWSDDNKEDVLEMSHLIMGFMANFMRTGDPNRGPATVITWDPWNDCVFKRKRLYWDYSFKMAK